MLNLTPAAQDERQRVRAEQEAARRTELTPAQQVTARRENARQHETRRAELTPEQQATTRRGHARQEAARGTELTPEEQATLRRTHAEHEAARRVRRRENETDVELIERLTADAERHRNRRVRETEAQYIARLRATRERRKARERSRPGGFREEVIDVYAEESNWPGAVRYMAIGLLGAVACEYCHALHFVGESATICCNNGEISNSLLKPLEIPPVLQELLTATTVAATKFRKHIRTYNSGLAMVSMLATERQIPGYGPPTYIIQGEVARRHGALFPDADERPKSIQTYFYDPRVTVTPRDPAVEVRTRLQNIPNRANIDVPTLQCLQEMLHEYNPFIRWVQTCIEIAVQQDVEQYRLRIVTDHNPAIATPHQGTYIPPTADEVATFILGHEGAQSLRDMIISARSGELQIINITHASYDGYMYPLFFPRGDSGWHLGVSRRGGAIVAGHNPKMSIRDWYRYKLHQRIESPLSIDSLDDLADREELPVRDRPWVFNSLLHGQRLFQQYVVDMYAKVEADRLLWIEKHQDEILTESFQTLRTAVEQRLPVFGTPRVKLPSSFVGGQRDLKNRYLDGMAMLRQVPDDNKADYFITFTCNPKWPDMIAALTLPCGRVQDASDRPDIVARVFMRKLHKLEDLLKKKHVMGHVIGYIRVIEFQKRGTTLITM